MKKNITLFLYSLILSSLIYAAPGGGHGGGPGGSKGPGGNKGPSQSHSRPSSDRKPEKSQTVGTKDRGGSELTYSFRGSRTTLKNVNLSVLDSFYSKENDDEINITVHFNKSLNPLSISNENILLNGSAVNEKIDFIYNKKVDSISFSLNVQEMPSIEFRNIEGIDGTKIDSIKIDLKEKK